MKTIYDVDQIKAMLPHRHPFLFLDRIVELEPGKKGTGIKNVTVSEPFFAGHFPNRAILPGVIIIEAIAQLITVIFISSYTPDDSAEPKIGYLAAIKDFKFRKVVVPGDQLVLKAEIVKTFGLLASVAVRALVNDEVVAEGSMMVGQSQ